MTIIIFTLSCNMTEVNSQYVWAFDIHKYDDMILMTRYLAHSHIIHWDSLMWSMSHFKPSKRCLDKVFGCLSTSFTRGALVALAEKGASEGIITSSPTINAKAIWGFFTLEGRQWFRDSFRPSASPRAEPLAPLSHKIVGSSQLFRPYVMNNYIQKA